MNNIIQELKTWAEAEQEKASRLAAYYEDDDNYEEGLYSGRFDAFSWINSKLALLLNSENENSSKSDLK